jgi:hypothetical protein
MFCRYLSGNQLNGSIPDSIGNLDNLNQLYVGKRSIDAISLFPHLLFIFHVLQVPQLQSTDWLHPRFHWQPEPTPRIVSWRKHVSFC